MQLRGEECLEESARGFVVHHAFVGGRDLGSAEVYDAATGTFTEVMAMSIARWGQTSTTLPDGRVLIAGGSTSQRALANAELYAEAGPAT